MTARYVAEYAWLGGEDLARNVLIEVDGMRFSAIEPDSTANDDAHLLAGVTLPGLVNAHSHAFHRALRGRTHLEGGDFWAWRDLMYSVAARLTPESYEELAAEVYSEMALAGFTTVGEFHYVHHQGDGSPYEDPNEMGHALVRAARRVGIKIALLDAGYLRAGFDAQELDPVQLRFADGSVSAWLDRVERLRADYRDADDVRIGIAPHSVRAMSEADLAEVSARRDPVPTHIHVSEQPRENEDCLAHTGATPTGVLERAGLLGADTTAIHATHLTDHDVELLGNSGTGVCYCATTERDLADGLGPAHALHSTGSRLSIGTDSHAFIDPFEEMRGIELHYRLSTGKRGGFAPAVLLAAGSESGALALGFEGGGITAGAPADFISVSSTSLRTRGLTAEGGAGHVVFAGSAADVTAVFVSGRKVV